MSSKVTYATSPELILLNSSLLKETITSLVDVFEILKSGVQAHTSCHISINISQIVQVIGDLIPNLLILSSACL
ncbi:hypothetical protein ACFLY2_00100 [Patescibacteria group bacterium]